MALCEHRDRLSPDRAAGPVAVVLQLDRRRARDPRYLCLWRARHQSLLSPAADASRLRASAVAGAYLRGDRGVLHAGHAGALGRGASPSSPVCRRAAGPAQPAGQFLLGPHGLDPGGERRAAADRHFRPLRARRVARSLLCVAGANAGLDHVRGRHLVRLFRSGLWRRAARRREPVGGAAVRRRAC